MKVLLDLPVAAGGLRRYGHDLLESLRAVDPSVVLSFVERPAMIVDRAFTPWGRSFIGVRGFLTKADLIHGLHLELPRTGRPTVVTVPDLIPLDYPASMKTRFQRRVYEGIVRRSSARANAIIVPSPSTKAALSEWGMSPEKVVVVPHGVSKAFVDTHDRASARRRFAGGRPYVACVGSSKPHKNMEVLPAVAQLLRDDGICVAIGGDASAFEGNRAAHDLERLGFLDDADLSWFFAGAEVVLIPSHIEGFGLPALEAIASGTPVICGTGLGALPYLEPAALVVDVTDPEEISGAVRSLVETPLRERLHAACGAIAERMSLEEMGRRTVEVYRGVLG